MSDPSPERSKQEDDPSRFLNIDVFTLKLGPDKLIYYVNKHNMCKAGFFAALLKHDNASSTIELPEANVDGMKDLIAVLHGTFDTDTILVGDLGFQRCIRLFETAKRYVARPVVIQYILNHTFLEQLASHSMRYASEILDAVSNDQPGTDIGISAFLAEACNWRAILTIQHWMRAPKARTNPVQQLYRLRKELHKLLDIVTTIYAHPSANTILSKPTNSQQISELLSLLGPKSGHAACATDPCVSCKTRHSRERKRNEAARTQRPSIVPHKRNADEIS